MERQSVQSCQELADLQAPMGVQIVEDPVEAFGRGTARRHVPSGGEIDAGACHAQVPDDLARGNDERGDQAARAVTDVLVLAFFRFAGLDESAWDISAGGFACRSSRRCR